MPNPAVEKYLATCSFTHGTGAGTDETAYYPALQSLLDSAGGGLKPRVQCVMGLKNQGAGMPDGGLFTPNQFQKGEGTLRKGQLPERGVVECKSPKEDVLKIAETDQVSGYWERNNQVLVTNYREFLLVGRDEKGKPVRHEHFRLADTEKAFWNLAARPKEAADADGDRLIDFLRRCIRRPAPLTDPKDVAWFFASYARDALGRVEKSRAHTKLKTIRKALEDALGLKVTDAAGEHFFESTLVQTLFYGVFSAWVLWHRSHTAAGERFNFDEVSRYLKVPILRKLFRELSDPEQLDEWDNLTEVMNWAADTLNRVDRGKFFEKFQDGNAVQYFYEPFLAEFDPDLRKALGVWYTPPEVVKYMVARVDQVLRTDFGKADGLADPDVVVLDPCCGTGAYLVETLNVIARTLTEKGEGALLAGQLKKAATSRVFGFEILPAPFVVAHLQLGLFLQAHGSPLDDKKHERAGVYLTNALTGWQPPTGPKQQLMFSEMEEERDAAEKVKQGTPILVVIGNPPYNGFAGLPAEEEAGLVKPYRETKAAPKPQGQGLNDLYVRFFRIAERCITERQARHGIVCYISNYSWLDGLSHTGLRERFLDEFDQIWIDSLNGDKYKTGKQTPEGLSDPSVFSTPSNREGIQVGTAIALLARTLAHTGPAAIYFRDFWGESKREKLYESGERFDPQAYRTVVPIQALGLTFREMKTEVGYTGWPTIPELLQSGFSGVQTKRDDLVVDIDEQKLRDRITDYFSTEVSHDEMKAACPAALKETDRFEARATREYLQRRGVKPEFFVRFVYRPFDLRWVYWEPETRLLGEKAPKYFPHVLPDNLWFTATQRNRKAVDPPSVTSELACLHLVEWSAVLFPMLLRQAEQGLFLEEAESARLLNGHFANLTDAALSYLNAFAGVADTPHLFHHAIAVLHAPAYATENGSALRQDWPRVPLPADRADLVRSADLGRTVAALLDPEAAVAGVTAGKLQSALKVIGLPTKTDGSQLNESAGDLDVTARWGIAGKGGITMPSNGRVARRPFDAAERVALGDTGVALLGPETVDVYLNAGAYWKNVPARVWEYTLGGYQVLKKWLSYREKALLDRGLTIDEVSYVQQVARRIAALILTGPDLDANYARVKAAVYPWGGLGKPPG